MKTKNWSAYSPLLLLFLPLVGMLISDEVNWSVFDFLIMGLLILSFSFGVKQVINKIKIVKYRVLLIGVIFLLFLLIWAELAVGIFGTRFAGN
jgi:hypothetical protein